MRKGYIVLILVLLSVGLKVQAEELPILMYHSVDDTNGWYSVGKERFEKDMTELKDAGYTTVSLEEVIDFVYDGVKLPPKPVVITFDDGYPNNESVVLPICERLGIKFEVFAVAGFVEYSPIGMSWEQARRIEESPYGAMGCHTCNFHNQGDNGRWGVSKSGSETFREWEHAFKFDLALARYLFGENGMRPDTFAYPYGIFTPEAERILRDTGYKLTVTSEKGVNIINEGDKESLFLMMRIMIDGSAKSALQEIERYSGIHETVKIKEAKSKAAEKSYVSRYEALKMLCDGKYGKNTSVIWDYYYDMKHESDDVKDVFSYAVLNNLVSGYPDLTMRPYCYITRGEFALILAKMTGYSGRRPVHYFTDSNTWNEGAISWCSENGYMIGYGEIFGTEDFLTREQIEIIRERLKNKPKGEN